MAVHMEGGGTAMRFQTFGNDRCRGACGLTPLSSLEPTAREALARAEGFACVSLKTKSYFGRPSWPPSRVPPDAAQTSWESARSTSTRDPPAAKMEPPAARE